MGEYDTAVLRGQALVDAYRDLRGESEQDLQQQVAEMVADLVMWLDAEG
jgi:acyl-CoA-binding protein